MVSKTAPLPNIRELFIPDPGYIIADADLAGADARVVAWDAGDEDLKDAFKAGLKVHAKNALDMFGPEKAGEDGKKKPLYDECKQAVHGTNYGGGAPTIAEEVGWTVGESRRFRNRWFDLHPAIKKWHEKVEQELYDYKRVTNIYGFRRVYFDRVDGLLPEALAWGPQSTVAIACFKGAMNVRKNLPWVKFLLQVHDSLLFQYPKEMDEERWRIKEQLETVTPYDDPLVIPWELSTSERSWGHAEERSWIDD